MLDRFQNFKKLLGNLAKSQNDQIELAREIEWAHIYHDSIRGKEYLQNLGLNVGRWAGNYSFFYVLNRILSDYQPKRILELGLGESSKFISTFLIHKLVESTHTVVEQDQGWIDGFNQRFVLSDRSSVIHCPIVEIQVNGFSSFSYQRFKDKISPDFDLFIVDGPFGSDRYSRFDILSLVEQFDVDKEFLILFDDSHRPGEQDTVDEICLCLNNKGVVYYKADYAGTKQNTVIASEAYKYSISF